MATLYKLPKLTQHPIALALMPGGMDDAEFDAFCADCEERGIISPATKYEGKILDGWHRYRAAERTGSELKFIEYTGNDPAGYISAVNVLRRKLSSLQRTLVGARLHRDYGLTQREACKKLGISNEVLNLVLKAMDSKNTRIIKRIESESDYSRSMLREELTESGILVTKAKPERVNTSSTPNSAFDLARASGAPVEPVQKELEYDMPDAGRKASHPERKSKKTAAQFLSEDFKALTEDEKMSFLQIIWPEVGGLFKARGVDLKCTPEGEAVPAAKVDAEKMVRRVVSYKGRLDGKPMPEPTAEGTAKVEAILAKAKKDKKAKVDKLVAEVKDDAKADPITTRQKPASVDDLLGKKEVTPLSALKAAVKASAALAKAASAALAPSEDLLAGKGDAVPTVSKKEKKEVDTKEALL